MDNLDFAAVTHAGALKRVNEDSVLARPPVFAVADGISGCQRGELASSLVLRRLARLADEPDLTPDLVAAALNDAHAEVLAAQVRDHHRAATTLCGAVALEIGGAAYWIVFNAGDSRLYRQLGPGEPLLQLSVDHSHVQELVTAGVITPEQAERHPERHVITRAVGSPAGFRPDYWLVPIVPGERLLICTDGLLRDVEFDRVERIAVGEASAAQAVQELLDLALLAGARDNVSIVVVDVGVAGGGVVDVGVADVGVVDVGEARPTPGPEATDSLAR